MRLADTWPPACDRGVGSVPGMRRGDLRLLQGPRATTQAGGRARQGRLTASCRFDASLAPRSWPTPGAARRVWRPKRAVERSSRAQQSLRESGREGGGRGHRGLTRPRWRGSGGSGGSSDRATIGRIRRRSRRPECWGRVRPGRWLIQREGTPSFSGMQRLGTCAASPHGPFGRREGRGRGGARWGFDVPRETSDSFPLRPCGPVPIGARDSSTDLAPTGRANTFRPARRCST
jgi:hypothetical protein